MYTGSEQSSRATSQCTPAGIENLVAQQRFIVGMGVEEVLYNSTGFITSVITEQSAAPMSREENVARALNVFEGLKGRQNKAYTFCLTEGMIEVA